MKLFDLHTLSRKEIAVTGIVTALLLTFQTAVVGLTSAHVAMAVVFFTLYLAHPATRRLALALLPFVAFEVCYDWMRIYPNYRVNPIDIRGLYEAEKSLFGITSEGTTMILGEFFNKHHADAADLLAGFFYLCWVPVPMAFGLYLYAKGERRLYLHFALTFLLVNLIGFVGYYVHPAAPPWYAINFGFEPDFAIPGNTAGLGRFDTLTGLGIFESIYAKNANIYAAIPSLHAAYMPVATAYAVKSRCPRPMTAVLCVITLGIWWTAVYSCHHYVIDVLLGIATAAAGIIVFEKGLMRWGRFSRWMNKYARRIS